MRPLSRCSPNKHANKTSYKRPMTQRRHCFALCFLALVTDAPRAADLQNNLSLQGFTGLINTPNAYVTPDSRVDVSLNNQLESEFVDLYPDGHSFLFSMGVLPYVELGGRLAVRNDNSRNNGDIRGGNRDLSGNIKLQIPWQREYFPAIALGAQDFGGGANNFRTTYLVATETLGPLQLSIGYGIGPDRMDGTFGGLALRTIDWLYLLADNDANESNVGLRLTTPRPVFGGLEANFTAKLRTTGEADDIALGITIRFPLGNAHHNSTPVASSQGAASVAATTSNDNASTNNQRNTTPPPTTATAPIIAAPAIPASEPATADQMPTLTASTLDSPYDLIARRLNKLGFQRVRVGADNAGTLYVQFENARYNHNFLDGMGLALGVATAMAPAEIETVEALATKRAVPTMRVAVPAALYRSFLADPMPVLGELRNRMRIVRSGEFGDSNIHWYTNSEHTTRTWLDIVLRPDVRTRVGTEYGTIDYSLALRTDARVNLWTGALLNTTWDVPVSHSDDLNPGRVYSDALHKSGLHDVYLQQLLPLTDTIANLTSVGQLYADDQFYNGAWNETVWSPRSGPHSLRAKLGYFTGQDDDVDRTMWNGYYNYFWAPKDIALELNYGQFWYQDTGFIFTARRFFGDTAVSAFLKYNGDKSGGITISLPLTPRQDLKPGLIHVRGTPRWTYDIQTSIGLAPNSNPTNTRIAVDRNPYFNVQKDVLDSGRLNGPYVREHVLRLRDAYVTWGAE